MKPVSVRLRIGTTARIPTAARWAKSGVSKRGPWVICVPCVARNNRKKGLQKQKAALEQEKQNKKAAIDQEKRELVAENEAPFSIRRNTA